MSEPAPPSETQDKPSGGAANVGGGASRGRLILRVCLAAVAITCMSLRLMGSSATDARAAVGASGWLHVTITEGPAYGSSAVHLGEDPAASSLGDESLRTQLRERISSPDLKGVLLQVAPGVYQSEVSRIRRLLDDAGEGSTIPIRLRRYHPPRPAP